MKQSRRLISPYFSFIGYLLLVFVAFFGFRSLGSFLNQAQISKALNNQKALLKQVSQPVKAPTKASSQPGSTNAQPRPPQPVEDLTTNRFLNSNLGTQAASSPLRTNNLAQDYSASHKYSNLQSDYSLSNSYSGEGPAVKAPAAPIRSAGSALRPQQASSAATLTPQTRWQPSTPRSSSGILTRPKPASQLNRSLNGSYADPPSSTRSSTTGKTAPGSVLP